MRLSSTTEKCPFQSLLLSKAATAVRAPCLAEESEVRKSTIPLREGSLRRKAGSPKSLSNVNYSGCLG